MEVSIREQHALVCDMMSKTQELQEQIEVHFRDSQEIPALIHNETLVISTGIEETSRRLHSTLALLVDVGSQSRIATGDAKSFHRFPDGIVKRIFSLVPDEEEMLRKHRENGLIESSLNSQQLPWRLTHVCRRWRSISLSLPRLWSGIDIKLTTHENDSITATNLVSCLSTQLQRSAEHPLSVSVSTEIPAGHPLLPVLLSSSSRWRDLYLRISLSGLRSFAPVTDRLQSLQTLYLRRITHWIENARIDGSRPSGRRGFTVSSAYSRSDDCVAIFKSAPQLRVLKLGVLVPQDPLSVVAFPYSQITDFSIGFAESTLQLTHLLKSRLQNVQNLDFQIFCYTAGWSLNESPITVARLVNLTTLRIEIANLDTILWRLETPALEYFAVNYSGCAEDFGEDVKDVLPMDMLQKSRCPLKVLNIESGHFTADEYIDLLAIIPTLLSLSIPSPVQPQAIIMGAPKFLRLLCERPSVVPSLKTLEIGNAEEGIPARDQPTTRRALQELLHVRRELRVGLWDAVEGGASVRTEHKYTPPAAPLTTSVEALGLGHNTRSRVEMPVRRPVRYARDANLPIAPPTFGTSDERLYYSQASRLRFFLALQDETGSDT